MQPLPDTLYRQMIEQTGEAVILADRQGIIRLWNRGAEQVFGHSAAEAVGHSLDLIIPEKLRARHWAGFNQVVESGVTRYADRLLAVPALHYSGNRLSIEFTVTLARDERDDIWGVAAFIRNVTVRWQQEKELRERLASLTRPL